MDGVAVAGAGAVATAVCGGGGVGLLVAAGRGSKLRSSKSAVLVGGGADTGALGTGGRGLFPDFVRAGAALGGVRFRAGVESGPDEDDGLSRRASIRCLAASEGGPGMAEAEGGG